MASINCKGHIRNDLDLANVMGHFGLSSKKYYR
jgi:hypothetical protein